jgi:hypothetical protein
VSVDRPGLAVAVPVVPAAVPVHFLVPVTIAIAVTIAIRLPHPLVNVGSVSPRLCEEARA